MSNSRTIDLTSAGLLGALAVIWGGSFFFAGIALREVPPLTITLFRVVLALPVLALILRARGLSLPLPGRTWAAWLVMGLLNNALPFSLIFWGQTRIDSGLASILNATTAMFAAIAAGVLLPDERLTWNKVAGAALGFAGVAIIMGPAALTRFDPGDIAQAAVLGAALSYAFAGVWGRVTLAGQPPLVNAFGMLAGSTVLMIPAALLADGPPPLALSPATWGALLGLALLSTSLAYILYFAILARAGAANVLLVTLLVPPVAIALGHFGLGERIGSEAWAGFAVIAAGFAVLDGRPVRRLFRGSR